MLARLRPVLRGLAGSRSVRKDKQKMCICSSKWTPAAGQGSWLGLAMRSCCQRPISIGLLHDGLASLLLCLFFWVVYFFFKKKRTLIFWILIFFHLSVLSFLLWSAINPQNQSLFMCLSNMFFFPLLLLHNFFSQLWKCDRVAKGKTKRVYFCYPVTLQKCCVLALLLCRRRNKNQWLRAPARQSKISRQCHAARRRWEGGKQIWPWKLLEPKGAHVEGTGGEGSAWGSVQ